jgi:acyl-CoA synthetase (AMP-forming)/AMP-acid ligase II
VRILNGEILVRSPTTMPGYVAEPELNQELFQDGFFRTGDLGELDERNNLRIRGRVKRMINVGGVKVDPVEIENVLLMLPGVRQCRVQGIKDLRETEIIKAEIVADPGRPVSRAQIVKHCRRRLAEYKIPRIIEFVGEITIDLAGKSPVSWREEK